MDPNDWYAAEILVKERLGDLRRTVESLRSPDGRPCPSLRVVVRTTLARLALWLLRPERRPAVPEPDRLNRPPPACRTCPCGRAREDRRDAQEGVRDERDPGTGERSMNFIAIEMLNG